MLNFEFFARTRKLWSIAVVSTIMTIDKRKGMLMVTAMSAITTTLSSMLVVIVRIHISHIHGTSTHTHWPRRNMHTIHQKLHNINISFVCVPETMAVCRPFGSGNFFIFYAMDSYFDTSSYIHSHTHTHSVAGSFIQICFSPHMHFSLRS